MKSRLASNFASDTRFQVMILVAFATLIGCLVRFMDLSKTDFPLNDGGLFHIMIQTLQVHHYSLPVSFTYNGLVLPFAYPPLGFYFTGILSDLLHITLLDIMRWLPPLVGTLTIPAFFYLANNLLPSKSAVLATFAFALLPRSYDWLIMGGGVTRSFGFLFAVLALSVAYQLITTPRWRYIWLTSILASLTILTHPEAALHTAYAVLLMMIFIGRRRVCVKYAFLVAVLTITITAPWWVMMVSRYGLEPYIAAAHSPQNSNTDLINLVMRLVLLFRFEFADEAYLPIFTVLGMVGLFASIGRRDWFLPAWLISVILLEPRSAPQYMIIPISLLTSQTISDIILPSLEKTKARYISPIFLGILLAYSIASALTISIKIADEITLKPGDREAMDWVDKNTPAESVFLLLTGKMPLRDPLSEWFPVLANRISAATVFGKEWIGDPPFSSRLVEYDALQRCRHQDLKCIDEWSQGYDVEYTHILITRPGSGGVQIFPLEIHLDADDNFRVVFRSPEISIYQFVPVK